MKPEEWRRVKELLDAALARAPEARPAFLDDACAEDPRLREQVRRLLSAHERAGEFGEQPVQVPADLLAGDPRSADGAVSSGPAATLTAPADGDQGGRARAAPFVRLMRVAMVVTVAVFAAGAHRLVTGSPYQSDFGWSERRQEDGGWVISSVDPEGPAAGRLEPGDVLVSFEGGPMGGRAGTVLYRRALDPGDSYRMAVDREGVRLEASLVVAPGPSVRGQRIYYYVLAVVWCTVGLFIGFARPDLVTARLAAAASWVTGFMFVDWALLTRGAVVNPLHVLLGFHFFSRFPSGRPPPRTWRWSLRLLYVVGLTSIAFALVLRGASLAYGLAGQAQLAARLPWLIELRPLLGTQVFRLSLVLMVLVGIANYRRLESEDQRRRVRWLVFGAVVGLAPQVIWVVAELVFGVPQVAWMETPANAFTLVVPVAAAYAVVKHRVFDIRVVIRRGLQYLLAKRVLQTAVAVPFVALAVTLVRHRQLTLVELVGETRGYLMWMVVAGVVLSARTRLQRVLDRRFFREQYDREQLLFEILDGVRKVDSISELAHVVHEQLVSALHPTAAYVWYRDPEELALASSTNPLLTPRGVPSDGAWLRWLERHGEAASLPLPAEAGVSRRESGWFAEQGIGLIVPIIDGTERLVGAVLLGEKRSEEPYSAGDTKLLSAVARQAAVVRENLRLRARVGEEMRVKHEVLARLDGRGADLLKECPCCGACFEGGVERCTNDGQALALSLPVRRTIDERYRLDRLLGKGGMGRVYEARDLHLDRTVAVKILLGSAFGRRDALRRFQREARTTARLTHPAIVTVHDYGMLEGEGAYLVMERLRGVTLRSELGRRGILPPVDAAAWLEPVLEGIAVAHREGVVHRDLKPENVMGEPAPDGVREVKILDLGLAKLVTHGSAATGTLTLHGVVMGTLAYMAPEQLAGQEVDPRADVFSLGVMLIEMLSGAKPAAATEPRREAALTGWAEGLAPSPHVDALDAVVRRCVAQEPAMRFASAAALAEALLPLLRASPDLRPASEADGALTPRA